MATRMWKKLSDVRKNGHPWWFRAHGKTQVTIEYVEGTDESLDPRKIHTVVTHATAAAAREQEIQLSTQRVQQTVEVPQVHHQHSNQVTQEKTGERKGDERENGRKGEREKKERERKGS